MARYLHQLLFDNETEVTISTMLTEWDAQRLEYGKTENGARLWRKRRDDLYLEWLIITGRLVDDLPMR